MKSTLIAMFFGGVALFSFPTDLSPTLGHTVSVISENSNIHPAFIATVIITADSSGTIPDTFDLFGTGESYTSTAASVVHFVRFIKTKIDPATLEDDPEESIRVLSRKGVLTDSTTLLSNLKLHYGDTYKKVRDQP